MNIKECNFVVFKTFYIHSLTQTNAFCFVVGKFPLSFSNSKMSRSLRTTRYSRNLSLRLCLGGLGKMRNWNSYNLSATMGFGCHGHSNRTICSPLCQFCSGIFPTSHFHTGEPILIHYPRGLILGVGRISQLPIWMTQRSFSAWGIQTGPLAAL